MRKIFLLLIAIISMIALSARAQQEVDGVITGGALRPMFLAMPDAVDETGNAAALGQSVLEIAKQDLVGSGMFQPVISAQSLQGFASFDERVDFDIWLSASSEILVKSAIAQKEDGSFEAKFRIYDVIAGSELGEGFKISGTADQSRRVGHKLADIIFDRVTGEGAYFDSKIAFVSETGEKGARQKSIAIMDSDGSNIQILTEGEEIAIAPQFMPNQVDILYTSFAEGMPQVTIVNSITKEKRTIATLDGMSFAPTVSKDGSFLVASSVDDQGNTDIVRIDLATQEKTQLTNDPAIDTAPSLSPDGTQMVFESNRTGTPQLFVMPTIAGGEAVQISSGEGRYSNPVWSPDGNLIAFTKIAEGEEFHIGVMRADGTLERMLTTSYHDASPAWAPNGKALVFYRETPGENGSPKLFSISLAARNMMALPTPEFASDPDWSALLD